MAKNYWLMKSEPDEFGIEDLKRVGVESWTGVRNYQARNFMRDEMAPGDEVLFYHSSTNPPGVAGVMTIDSNAYADPTQFDSKSAYFDEKATKENPRWFVVDVKFKSMFKKYVSLEELKKHKELSDLTILKKGSRLSICPVSAAEFKFIVDLGK